MTEMTIRELLDSYRAGSFSPVEVTHACLDTITALNGEINAFITVLTESALRDAETAAERLGAGDDPDCFAGIPVSYKDMIDTRGIRTTSGSRVDENRIPSVDANIVGVLGGHGAVNLGKTNLDEYGLGVTANNAVHGPVRNPWNRERSSGGSSGGSAAAVACNMSFASMGTDTGGSVRIPAACCGVVGLKPTYGLIATEGVMPLSPTLDHLGPLTRNVSDLAWIMKAIANVGDDGPPLNDVRGRRIGVPKKYFNEAVDGEVTLLYESAVAVLQGMGAVVVEVDMPPLSGLVDAVFALSGTEASFAHRDRRQMSIDLYSDEVRKLLLPGLSLSAQEYLALMDERGRLQRQISELFEVVDVIVTPTIPTTPRGIGINEVEVGGQLVDLFGEMIRFTSVFNMSGHPALSIPCGLTADGMPVGLQIVGAYYSEPLMMQVAFAYEQAALDGFYAERSKVCSGLLWPQ